MNKIKKRGLNGFFLKTNDHFIEIFFPVELGLTCINKISIFELDKGPKKKKVKEFPCIYPTIDENGDLNWKYNDPYKKFESNFSYGSFGDDMNYLKVTSRYDDLKLDITATMPSRYESHYWL